MQTPRSKFLILSPVSGPCKCSSWSQEPGAWDLWYLGRQTCESTGAGFLRRLVISVTDHGPATSTQCVSAAGGIGRGGHWLATWPAPAALGAAALSDAGLGTWRETQPNSLTDTAEEGEKVQRWEPQMPGLGDTQLLTGR